MSTITTIEASDIVSASRSTINTNFANLNTDKIEADSTDTLTNKTLTAPVLNGALTGDAKSTGATINTGTADDEFVTPKAIADSVLLNLAEGGMLNGRILPSVTSNNLTVALKTLAGTDPSATNPVIIMIGGVLRKVTSALSVTKNAAANWCASGSAELATKEIDYFTYLGYNSTDGVVIGFSRVPSANIYSDFSATTTNEKYCAISTITNAAAGDNYIVIGRFAATLSAGTGYTWTVPTFTAVNLIQRPIFETRKLSYAPVFSAISPLTYGTVTASIASYRICGSVLYFVTAGSGTTGGSAGTDIVMTLPFGFKETAAYFYVSGAGLFDGGDMQGYMIRDDTNSGVRFLKYNKANWGIGAARDVRGAGFYEI